MALEYTTGKKNEFELTMEWKLYQAGIDYNEKLDYYTNVDRNWRFYNGDQWAGVTSGNLPKPVFNIFKRIINYFIAAILSQKVKGTYTFLNVPDEPNGGYPEYMLDNPEVQQEMQMRNMSDLLTQMSEYKWEKEKMDFKLRELLLDGANSGDMCAYVYWDTNYETGQDAKGDFCTEIVDGGNVFFGNPNCADAEKQPYILIVGRDSVKNLKAEAKRNGIPDTEISGIMSDEETQYQAGDAGKFEIDNAKDESKRCLYVIKFWKQDGTVKYVKATRHARITKEIDMGLRRYPIAWGNWEKIKNSYHGRAVGTGLIPNQIYINKQFAMSMLWLMNMAYGKVVYDSTRISGWDNQIGTAQPVMGEVTGAVQQLQPGQMNNVVLDAIEKAIQYTKDMLGANDGALGEINPEQASGAAIIAVQKQAAIPLENVQAMLYQFVEDILLIWGEFYLRKYNADRIVNYKDDGKNMTTNFNSTPYMDKLLHVKIDVGPSTYWSEVASMQTLDGLLKAGSIDIIQYLERIPNGIIPKKQELIEEIKQRMEQQQAMQQEQAMQAEQMQMQEQDMQMQEEAIQAQEQEAQFESMAQFIETLPPDVQAQIQQLPPDMMEQAVQNLMRQQVNQTMKASTM